MSLTVTISVQNPSKLTYQFRDVAALNADLLTNTGAGELMEEFTNEDFVRFNEQGAIEFFDRESEEHMDAWVQVWSCFNLDEAQVLANYMTSGQLVIRQDTEGNDPTFFKITPGNAEEVDPSF